MIDHLGIGASDLARSRDFFLAALRPLGATLAMEDPVGGVGIGQAGKPALWLSQVEQAPTPLHIAFTASSRAEVDA